MLNSFNKKSVFCLIALSMQSIVYADEIAPIDCMIEPNLMVEISSPVEGVLDTISVDRSDEVKKGEVVATIKSDVEQLNVKISQERLKLSEIENRRAADLYRKKVITLTEKDKLENEKKLYELDLQNAKANLALRQVRSPIDAIVVKRYFSQGEFVESKPIVKLAQLDPLKIEVISLVSNYGKIVKGMRARIVPEHGDYSELIADVVVVDKVIDAASGTFGVRLELANKDHAIPSGLKCKVHFLPVEVAANNANNINETDVSVSAVAVIDEMGATSSDVSVSEDLICSSIGPYKKQADLAELLAEMDEVISRSDTRTETEEKTTYLIVSNEFATLQEVNSVMQEMKLAGVTDMAKMNKGGNHRIALGLFSSKTSAINRLNSMQAKGYKVQMKPKQRAIKAYWADIAYTPDLEDTITTLVSSAYKNTCKDSTRLSLLNNH